MLLLVDLDGVVYRASEGVPGVGPALADRAALGDVVVYVTNNAMHYHGEYVARLASHGAPVGPDRVVTSASASAVWLRDHLPHVRRVLAVGAAGLERELREAEFDVVTAAYAATRMSQEGIDGWAAAGHPDAVVVGLDPQLDVPADRRGGRLRAGRRRARRDEQGPDLPDRARVPARRGLGGGGDRDRGADDGPGVDRQARAVPARGGRAAGRGGRARGGDDRRRAHGRGGRQGRGGADGPDADRGHVAGDGRRAARGGAPDRDRGGRREELADGPRRRSRGQG